MNTVDTKSLKTAKRYAAALVALNKNEKIKQDLGTVQASIFSNDDFVNFFSHPVISLGDKKDTINQIFNEKIDQEVLNLLYVLLDNNRFLNFPLIYEVFTKECELAQNIIHAEILSAVDLNENQKNSIGEKLNQKLQKQVICKFQTDKKIIGGLTIKIGDNVIDLSLKSKFDKLKKA